MSKVYQIHVDTSSTVANTIQKLNNNPFQCSVFLGQTHRRVRKVSLKSAEIPVSWNNIRSPYNSFVISVAGVQYSYTVAPGVYSTATLLIALNTAINSSTTYPIAGTPLTLNAGTGRITFVNAGGNTIIIAPPRSLGYFLGFVNGQSGTTIVATNGYLTSIDNYVAVYIENLRASSLEPNVPITFKIPIIATSGSINFYSEGGQWKQMIEIYDPNVRIDRLNITVLDRYGQQLDNNGNDWTFTLEVESDT